MLYGDMRMDAHSLLGIVFSVRYIGALVMCIYVECFLLARAALAAGDLFRAVSTHSN